MRARKQKQPEVLIGVRHFGREKKGGGGGGKKECEEKEAREREQHLTNQAHAICLEEIKKKNGTDIDF